MFKDVRVYGVAPKEGTVMQDIRQVELGMRRAHYIGLNGLIEITQRTVSGIRFIISADNIASVA